MVDLDAGTYNVRKATSSYYCISCDGAVNAVIGQPIDFLVAAQQPLSFLDLQNTGQTYNYPWDAAWSSDDTYVASIDQNGMASGVSEGTFNVGAYASSALIYNPHYCAYNASCPAQGALQNTSGGSVNACVTPDGETTSPIRQTLIYPYTPTTTDCLQTLIATRPDNGAAVDEAENATGTDSCHYIGSAYDPWTAVTGGHYIFKDSLGPMPTNIPETPADISARQ